MEEKKLIIDIQERPEPRKWLFLSIQHVFAMFGATILVPILTGYPVSVALFASGIGTLIYSLVTKGKVPVYLGSSFAYITAVIVAVEAMGGNISAAQTGLILVGLIYCLVALLIKFIGKEWIDVILPPVVIGPMIMVIGLGLASTAVSNSGLIAGGDPRNMIIAGVTFLTAAFFSSRGKGFFRIIPFLIAIIVGFILSVVLGLVDFSTIASAPWFAIPEFALPFKFGNFNTYSLYFGPETLAILPVALVTISEHIGDHIVLGQICGKNFLKEPGLNRTLVGDGLATAISGFLGGPANTTYGENTGVIGMTKIGSVYVTCGAAVFAIILSTCGKVAALISVIPTCVLGGMSIMLYGVIASNGLRVLIENRVDFSKQKNLIITSAMLVLGLGGAMLPLPGSAILSGTALCALVGIILNLIIPDDK